MSKFHFKEFSIVQDVSAMKVGTDAMVLGALIDSCGKERCLDIGTGTGVISLMIAQRNPKIQIEAIEIDFDSAKEAKINFQNSDWSEQLNVIHVDFKEFNSEQQYDLIVSNPPYFENGILNESTRKANTRHEESLPLTDLFQKVAALLTLKGHFWLILPYETSSKWKKSAKELNLYCEQEITVFGKPNVPKRTVFCFSRTGVECTPSFLVIRNEDNMYTEQYKQLTIDFHGVVL
jgi:tRNA1Val (adenine37-N6)-methyltransferase